MRLRPIQRDDTEALRVLWNRSAQNDQLSTSLMDEKLYSDPDFVPALTRIAMVPDRLVGWGMAVHRREPANRGHVKFLVVDPSVQRQGIGTRILADLESELVRRGCPEIRIDEAAPNYLNPGIDVEYTVGITFLAARGYREMGQAVHQRVDLSGRDWSTESDEARLRQMGVTVARANQSNRKAVMMWLQVHWPPWMAEVDQAFANDPVTLHLAWRNDRVIGFAAYDANNRGLGWFGPMGTDPHDRGSGIGRVLLWRCLSDQRRQGYTQSIIPWVGPIEFYHRHAGAEVWRTFRRMSKSP